MSPPNRIAARIAIVAMPLVLSACAAGERGLVSPHQPIVGAAGAHVPGGPDWSDTSLTASEGQASNFGCATATNLAAMIADPADLIHGKTGNGTGSAEVAVRAIKAQRDLGASGKNALDKVSAKGGS